MPKSPDVATRPSPAAAESARRTGVPSVPHVAWLIGPALVAGVAYLDPGNVASNMTAGAQYGYLLVWVVVLGNTMAWLIQYLSAKLGVVTGKSLPEVLGERIGNRWGRRAYWLQAELVAMATDLAEVIGGAVALNLLFGVPLVWGGLITGAVSLVLLVIQSRRGARPFEFVIVGLLVIITVGFTVGVFVARRSRAVPMPRSSSRGASIRWPGPASAAATAAARWACVGAKRSRASALCA